MEAGGAAGLHGDGRTRYDAGTAPPSSAQHRDGAINSMATAPVATGDRDGVRTRRELVDKVAAYEQALPWMKFGDGAHTVRMALPSMVCLRRALRFFKKEPETLRWISGFAEGAVLFDVGANIGVYSLWAGLTRRAQVFAFEPEAGNYSTLNVNLRLNGLAERCRAYCMGLSDAAGLDTLVVGRQTAVGASGHQIGSRAGGGIPQGIPVTTLDQLVYEAGLPCPSHVKIDVDGLEPAIVRAARACSRTPGCAAC